MNSSIFNSPNDLPETAGVYNFLDKSNQSLFVSVAENLKKTAKKILAKNVVLKTETAKIETTADFGNDLIRLYAQIIRRTKSLYNFSLAAQNLYTHFKITTEKFPRLLVTRRVETDAAEYFGAFLPETGARFMLGFLIDAFGLRGCDIPIDGNFAVPCPQFYRKKCVAPCVKNLCGVKSYAESVNMARLFLKKNQAKLNEILLEKIQIAAAVLDFETAAKLRDLLENINRFFVKKDRQYWLNDAVDTFEIEIVEKKILVRLVTQRNRKILGKRTFEFENEIGFSRQEIIEQILWQFYQFHAPKEIVIPFDFPSREFLTVTLNRRAAEDSKTKISVVKKAKQRKTTGRALKRAEFEHEFNSLRKNPSVETIQEELKSEFLLKNLPERIEAFDVAHISGADFVGAKSVWENGRFLAAEYEFWFLDLKSELASLGKTLENRFIKDESAPDLILIDGGKSQLETALKAVKNIGKSNAAVISAVKPPQKHNEISYFLTADGRSVKFNSNSEGFRLLLKLRDEAHRTANYIHRTKRETAHFFELFAALPFLNEKERYDLLQKFGSLSELKNATEIKLKNYLGEEKGSLIYRKMRNRGKIELLIVPIRYDDPNGEAGNLQPLFAGK